MNKFLKLFTVVATAGFINMSTANAKVELSKDEVKAQAVNICQEEARKRYGKNSVRQVGSKAKWMKSMDGASVKMKVKPESKRAAKYSCLLKKDNSVTFLRV